MTKIAILDDYVGVALKYGDWSALPDDAEISVYREAIPPERLVDELSDYEIIERLPTSSTRSVQGDRTFSTGRARTRTGQPGTPPT